MVDPVLCVYQEHIAKILTLLPDRLIRGGCVVLQLVVFLGHHLCVADGQQVLELLHHPVLVAVYLT